MLLIQDIHIVRGRAELPFEDGYRDDIVPRLADLGAQLRYFGWSPHGAGAGYEAIVLTEVDDGAALMEYQQAVAFGALADVWERFETSDHELRSSLLVAYGTPDWSASADGSGPRTLFRHDTLAVEGPLDAAVASVEQQYADAPGDALLRLVGCFEPAVGELAEPEVTVLTRVASFDGLQAALGALDAGPWSGTPDVDGLLRRQVRISRCAEWSPLR